MKQSLQSYAQHIFLDSWRPFLWLTLIGLCVYIQSLSFGFSFLDDNVLILDHLDFMRNPFNFLKLFSQDIFFGNQPDAPYYRPLLATLFMFEAWLFGDNPAVYHLTNVILHVAATCFLFLLLLKLNFSKAKSFILSVLFVVHPVLGQAVYWIPGRNDSLLTLLILISFSSFIRFLKTEKKKDYFVQILFFALALLVKESALVFPLVCIAYLFLINGKTKKNIVNWQVLGLSVVVACWFIARKLAIGSMASFSVVVLANMALANLSMVFLYFGKIFLPFNLSILPTLPDSNFLYGFFCVVGFSILLSFCSKENWKYVIFGFFWFFAFLMMAFLKPYWSTAHDFQEHRIYLPMIGFIIALAALRPLPQWRHRNVAGLFLAMVFFLLFVGVQFNHGQKYKNRLNFWISASEDSPNLPLAHRNLGAIYYLEGNWNLAEKEHKKSLLLNPYEAFVHNNLGLIYMNQGKPRKAEEEFLKELSLRPNSSLPLYNLGVLYYRQGSDAEAEISFLKSIEKNPSYLKGYRALSVMAYKQGDLNKAKKYSKELEKRGETIDFTVENFL